MVHRYHILPTLNLYRAKSSTTATRRTHSPSNLLNHVTIKPFHAAYRPAVHVCLCCAVTSTLDSDFPTATTSGSKSYLISTSFIWMGRPRHVNPHHDEWKVFRHLPSVGHCVSLPSSTLPVHSEKLKHSCWTCWNWMNEWRTKSSFRFCSWHPVVVCVFCCCWKLSCPRSRTTIARLSSVAASQWGARANLVFELFSALCK